MSKVNKQLETFYATNRQEWREWLIAILSDLATQPKKIFSFSFGLKESAKRSQTRAKRIEQTVIAAAQNQKPLA